MAEPNSQLSVTLQRQDPGRYTVTNSRGVTIDVGTGDDTFRPVELLLAALAACTSVDVDTVLSRRNLPFDLTVTARGDELTEQRRATRLGKLGVSFDITVPDTPEGRTALKIAPRAMKVSHDTTCTVSRTLEHGQPVRNEMRINGEIVS